MSLGQSVLPNLDRFGSRSGGHAAQSSSSTSVKTSSSSHPSRSFVPTPSVGVGRRGSLTPSRVARRSEMTEKWRVGLVSNFEYLMLNTVSGRSYNDITQYPVYPWVIADYESSSLDFNSPSRTFRDLKKPVGALNDSRLKQFLERCELFESEDTPRFHYGSHYSSAGVVLYYLLRMEPYTTLAIALQGGRFDCPDRLLHSIQDCWLSCLHSMSDVKELIPEFFFCPEFLTNSNGFNLGCRQDGQKVDNVVLPPWAKGSAHEFIRTQSAALESEYVSANLHHWIDLIFGYKQRGPAAEEAFNLFYYLTYEGAVDIDSIEDPIDRTAAEAQIAHFGQTPSQLFSVPHTQRAPWSQLKHHFSAALLTTLKRQALSRLFLRS